jgi:hypothetical protein
MAGILDSQHGLPSQINTQEEKVDDNVNGYLGNGIS